MAIKVQTFSPKSYEVGVQQQTAFGTGLISGMTKLDVDSITYPTSGITQILEQKAGDGFMVQKTDTFQTNKLAVTEFTVSGTLKESYGDIFLENMISGESSGVHTLLSNFTPALVGIAGASDDVPPTVANNLVLTFAIKTPVSNKSIILKDCVVTSFSISADTATESGRLKYSATVKTGSLHTFNGASDATIADLGTDDVFIGECATSDYRIAHGLADSIVSSFTLNLESDAVFLSANASGDHDVVSRASEFIFNADMSIKYDATTEPLLTTWQTQTGGASVAVTSLANVATPADGTFGWKIYQGLLTNVAINEGEVAMLDISVKGLGNGGSGSALVVAF